MNTIIKASDVLDKLSNSQIERIYIEVCKKEICGTEEMITQIREAVTNITFIHLLAWGVKLDTLDAYIREHSSK